MPGLSRGSLSFSEPVQSPQSGPPAGMTGEGGGTLRAEQSKPGSVEDACI